MTLHVPNVDCDSLDPTNGLFRLPEDLWSTIFELSLPERPSFSPHASPAVLMQVCRSWRHVALHTPLLWSTISLESANGHATLGLMELSRLWMTRSQDCPLDIDLRLPFDVLPWSIDATDDEFKVVSSLIDVLVRQQHSRLRSLLRSYPHTFFNQGMGEQFPLLEELFIVDPPRGTVRIFPAVELPPALLSLSMFNTYAHFTPATRWPDLQHLEIWQTDAGFAGLSPGDCLNILNQLSNLRSVGLHISVDDDETRLRDPIPTKVTLPHLRSVVISSFVAHDLTLLFNALELPVAEAIAFDGCVCPSFYAAFPDFLQKCVKTLRLLALGQVGMVNVTLLGLLSILQNHTRVSLCSSSFCGHVAQRVGRARRTERGIEYADRWTSKGAPGHLLSLAYTSKEMWSQLEDDDISSFTFPTQTFRHMDEWSPADPGSEAADDSDTSSGEGSDSMPQSVLISICKGASVGHAQFVETWVS